MSAMGSSKGPLNQFSSRHARPAGVDQFGARRERTPSPLGLAVNADQLARPAAGKSQVLLRQSPIEGACWTAMGLVMTDGLGI